MSGLPSPLKWHGGKHYLAARIRALFPPHIHYVEPYAGSLAVLLATDGEGVSEVANDLDGELVNFWACLRDPLAFRLLQRHLEAMPFSEREWRESGLPDREPHQRACSPESPVVDRAIAFFVRCRQAHAGRMDGFAALSRRRLRRGMNEQVSAWLSAIDGLPEVHARLRRVVLLDRPALQVIRGQDGPDTLFYLDPPYLPSTRATPDVYRHEMSVIDHEELLAVVGGLQGRMVLSGYHSPLYDEAARKFSWNVHEIEQPLHSAAGAEKQRKVEVLWTNY